MALHLRSAAVVLVLCVSVLGMSTTALAVPITYDFASGPLTGSFILEVPFIFTGTNFQLLDYNFTDGLGIFTFAGDDTRNFFSCANGFECSFNVIAGTTLIPPADGWIVGGDPNLVLDLFDSTYSWERSYLVGSTITSVTGRGTFASNTAVPEPSAAILLSFGVLGLFSYRWLQRRQAGIQIW